MLRESLRIVTIRYQRGITNELDVQLATRELDTLEAQMRPAQAQVNAAQYTLATLLGEYPEIIGARTSMLESESRRRPGAGHRRHPLGSAQAPAGHSRGRARAGGRDRAHRRGDGKSLPRLPSSAPSASEAPGVGTTPYMGKHIWSFGPGAIWPLLDFGALDAQVDIAQLEAHARLVKYRKTILSAVQEVDDALDSYGAEQDRLKYLAEAMLAGQRAVELATERYNRGLTDFLNVIDAEHTSKIFKRFSMRLPRLLKARSFVQLYKKPGRRVAEPSVAAVRPRPQPAIIAAFRRTLESSAP